MPDVPPPTTALIVVGDTTVNELAAVPPKLTPTAPVKFVPVITIVPPAPVDVGAKDVMVGGGARKKNPAFNQIRLMIAR